MDYLIDALLVGAATYYTTELILAPWNASRLLKTLIDLVLSGAGGYFIYPHNPLGIAAFLTGNLIASVVRVAIDAVTSKPRVLNRR